MTLLDFPGKVAATVFFHGCDLRCPFCHNFELVKGPVIPVMDDTELISFLKKRKGLLDGVCFTGGEPLLQADLRTLIEKTKAIGYAVKLDTNGTHPEKLKLLTESGMTDYVAMDIKNSPSKYPETTGIPTIDTEKIRESISILLNGSVDYEFRTTVVDKFHSEDSFTEIGEMINGAKRYFLQPFTDRETVPFGGLTAPSPEELERYKNIVAPFVDLVQIRGA